MKDNGTTNSTMVRASNTMGNHNTNSLMKNMKEGIQDIESKGLIEF
jgi:hypothetical protein